MSSIVKIIYIAIKISLLLSYLSGCEEKDISKNDPAAAFANARDPYDDGNYEIARQRLNEFKSRFPYSKFATLAELYTANCNYQLGNFQEAAWEYGQFVKLHPTHEKTDFAMFRIAKSFWQEAPEEIDREQEYTEKAINAFEALINKYPKTTYKKEASELMEQGQRRIAESYNFVAEYYCKMEIEHACAWRYIMLMTKFPQYTKLYESAALKAANSFEKMAAIKAEDPNNDKNIYFKELSADQLRARARDLRKLVTKKNN